MICVEKAGFIHFHTDIRDDKALPVVIVSLAVVWPAMSCARGNSDATPVRTILAPSASERLSASRAHPRPGQRLAEPLAEPG